MLPWVWYLLGLLSYSDVPISTTPCFLQVYNGTVGCVGDNTEVICEVKCAGRYEGRFHCSEANGWKEKLPYCVKPTKDLISVALCRDDEVYSECEGHCERSCSDWTRPTACASNVCVGACVCGAGLVRGPDGKCIPLDSCSVPSGRMSTADGNADFGCPDQEKCNELCKMLSYMTKLKGRCVGPNNLYCTCTL